MRQLLEHGRTAFRVVARGQHAFWLVIDQHFGVVAAVGGDDKLLGVEHDAVAGMHAGTDFGRRAVELHFAGLDPLLQHAARAEAGVRQYFVQALFERRGIGAAHFAFQG